MSDQDPDTATPPDAETPEGRRARLEAQLQREYRHNLSRYFLACVAAGEDKVEVALRRAKISAGVRLQRALRDLRDIGLPC